MTGLCNHVLILVIAASLPVTTVSLTQCLPVCEDVLCGTYNLFSLGTDSPTKDSVSQML